MNFFAKLFGKKRATETPSDDAQMTENLLNQLDMEDLPSVDEDLFVAKQSANQANKSEKRLKRFLQDDHFQKGYSDGYNYHNASICENYVETLQNDFEEMMEEEIEKLRMYKRQLTDHKIAMQDIDPNLGDAIEMKVDDVEAQILRYEEYVLKMRDEKGIGAKPISKYRDGFRKGMHTYVNEELNHGPSLLND